jgi:uncharacterized protein (DUF2147 family)
MFVRCEYLFKLCHYVQLRALSTLSMLILVACVVGSHASSIEGIWLTHDGTAAVSIAPCSESICGHIYWLRDPYKRDGQPFRDQNNPDVALRQQFICGLRVIGGLKAQQDGSWDYGWIYDPKSGKSFDLAVSMENSSVLSIQGYRGTKLFSRSHLWKRASPNLGQCANDTQRKAM